MHADVQKYLEFKAVDGSYVLNRGKVEKVPATPGEALRSNLLGLIEKGRVRFFLRYTLTLVGLRTAHCLQYESQPQSQISLPYLGTFTVLTGIAIALRMRTCL